ncbi:MAG TPA: DUF5989 family protein [Myxococcota bacterium]|mgnify:FL=1|nr:DUF5989 family protein [Myxococcota bacterium]
MDERPHGEGDWIRHADAPRRGLVVEVWGFLKTHKKWWLLPLVLALLAVGLLAVLGGSPAAPFIYTLF